MRAAVVTRFGGPEVFELAERPDPVPGPGQVAIAVTYALGGLASAFPGVARTLGAAAEAHRRAETGSVAGRILLAP